MLALHAGLDGLKRGHLFGWQYVAFETADTDNQFIEYLVQLNIGFGGKPPLHFKNFVHVPLKGGGEADES
jgi:hypothetical protein